MPVKTAGTPAEPAGKPRPRNKGKPQEGKPQRKSKPDTPKTGNPDKTQSGVG